MISNRFRSAAAWALLALAAGSFSARAELKPEDIYSRVSPSVVSLEVENKAGEHFIGSAFLALGDNLAITAWHVIYDARRVEARFADGKQARVLGIVDKNEALDLALIELQACGRPKIKLNSTTPRIGSRVYVVGSPRGFDFSMGEGLISQLRTVDGVHYYQLSCPISPGDSGGPVLNDRGEVIGVVSWRKADAENLAFAIPCPAAARLNPSRPVLAWGEKAPALAPSRGPSDSGPLVRVQAPAANHAAIDSYHQFLQELSGRAGQRVTVIVKDQHGKESRFNFAVPKQGTSPKPASD
jgi:serine protease Do